MRRRFLIFVFCLALCAQAGIYHLTVRGGRIFYRQEPDGIWQDVGMSARDLPFALDRAMLSGGVWFGSRAGLTHALEDFCSCAAAGRISS